MLRETIGFAMPALRKAWRNKEDIATALVVPGGVAIVAAKKAAAARRAPGIVDRAIKKDQIRRLYRGYRTPSSTSGIRGVD